MEPIRITLPEHAFTAEVAATIKQHAVAGAVVALVDYSGDFASPAGLAALAALGVDTTRLPCATLTEYGGACEDDDALDATGDVFAMVADVVVIVRGFGDGDWLPAQSGADCWLALLAGDATRDQCHDAREVGDAR